MTPDEIKTIFKCRIENLTKCIIEAKNNIERWECEQRWLQAILVRDDETVAKEKAKLDKFLEDDIIKDCY